MAGPACRLEDIRRIIRDDVDAVQLSKGLRRHGDEDACPITAEHVAVGSLAFLTLQQNVHLDISVFVTCLGVVDVAASIQVSNNDDTLFIVVVVEEPSGLSLAQINVTNRQRNVPWGLDNDQTSESKQAAHNALHEEGDSP